MLFNMNNAELLKSNLSRRIIDEITFTILNDDSKFLELFQLLNHSDYKIAWRATWACEKIIENKPTIINDDSFEKIISLTLSTQIVGQRRLLLSIINKLQSNFPIPPVSIINNCFDWMISEKQPVAVQSLSLKILTDYCRLEPDLKLELFAYLDNFGSLLTRPAMISASKRAIKMLKMND